MGYDCMARVMRNRLNFLFLALLPIVIFAGHSGIAKFSGHYTAPATYCSELDSTVLKPCDPPAEDSMTINPIDATHARIDIYSLQTNGHECRVTGVAELTDDKLVLIESDKSSRDFGKGFSVEIINKMLTIKYLEDPGLGFPAFCGARARLDRLKFHTGE